MTAKDYPVTFPYGATSAPYGTSTNPYHRGDDRGMPLGTAVVVNGVVIGLSGSTGWSSGPHLHIGKWLSGKDVNPNGGGFDLPNAKVTQVGEDSVNGKFVRIQSDNFSWVYLHLSKQLVSVGQVLQGVDMSDIADHDFVARATVLTMGVQPEVNQAFMNNIGLPKSEVLKNIEGYSESRDFRLRAEGYRDLEKQIADLKAQLASKPTVGGLTPEQAAQLTETNSIVKQIWNKITGIFK